MDIRDIDPVFYAFDLGTGVVLARAEDKPPRGALVDFMRGDDVIRPGAVVPVHWKQIWDYASGYPDTPSLFRWPQFKEWLDEWPKDLDEFKRRWKREFGMPGNDEADGVLIVWEEKKIKDDD